MRRGWLPPLRKYLRREETTPALTPTTHGEPRLNELDPNDEAVMALTSHDDGDRLPPTPVTRALR